MSVKVDKYRMQNENFTELELFIKLSVSSTDNRELEWVRECMWVSNSISISTRQSDALVILAYGQQKENCNYYHFAEKAIVLHIPT